MSPSRDPISGPPEAVTPRALTRRELAVLASMVDRATRFDQEGPDDGVEDADRARWRAQLTVTRAGRRCGCGSCPSIELTGAAGDSPSTTRSRVILEAQTDEASLLLFIDDDRLSYLELAPLGDRSFVEFPDPDDIRTV